MVPSDLEVIKGGDHLFNVPKSIGKGLQEIYGRILNKVLVWLGECGNRGGETLCATATME